MCYKGANTLNFLKTLEYWQKILNKKLKYSYQATNFQDQTYAVVLQVMYLEMS